MDNLKVFDLSGQVVGKAKLDANIFGIAPNNQVIYDALMVYRSNSRQATSRTKTRDEVSGGGKKPWRQKGTGRARQGSIRSPQWRGGGVVFGPTGDQNFKIKQNRKERILALKSALSQKVLDEKLVVVNHCRLDEIKTKLVVAACKALNLNGKVLFVIGMEQSNIEFGYSAMNIQNVEVVFYDELNVHQLVSNDYVVIAEEALERITEVLNG